MSTTTSLHITASTALPRAALYTYPSDAPIAAVRLDDGAVTISSKEPAHLLLIAEAFTDAARRLSQQLDLAVTA